MDCGYMQKKMLEMAKRQLAQTDFSKPKKSEALKPFEESMAYTKGFKDGLRKGQETGLRLVNDMLRTSVGGNTFIVCADEEKAKEIMEQLTKLNT